MKSSLLSESLIYTCALSPPLTFCNQPLMTHRSLELQVIAKAEGSHTSKQHHTVGLDRSSGSCGVSSETIIILMLQETMKQHTTVTQDWGSNFETKVNSLSAGESLAAQMCKHVLQKKKHSSIILFNDHTIMAVLGCHLIPSLKVASRTA